MNWISLTLALVVASCGGLYDGCGDKIASYKEEHGQPEDVQVYSSGDYTSTTIWYWSKGISRTFVDSGGSCETSDYYFTPIRP